MRRTVTGADGGEQKDGKKRANTLIRIVVPILIVVVLFGAAAIFLSTYYHADEAAVAAFSAGYAVEENKLDNGNLTFGIGRESFGLIFYPGGKVDEAAYAPLMRELAENGVFCVICRMPCHLAVLNGSAADGIREDYPEVENWYMAGHSLGGVMAASYLAEHSGFDGLILLASYSQKDLSDSGLRVLSIYGSEDGVMDFGSYESSRANLPADALELVIEGGCHAGFGMYGPQRGDGTPTITDAEQIRRAASAILTFLSEKSA